MEIAQLIADAAFEDHEISRRRRNVEFDVRSLQGLDQETLMTSHHEAAEVFEITADSISAGIWKFGIAGAPPACEALRFHPNGKILGYSHPNEVLWSVDAGVLLTKKADGHVTTRFEIAKGRFPLTLTGQFLDDPLADITLELEAIDWDRRPAFAAETAAFLAEEIVSQGWKIGRHTYGNIKLFSSCDNARLNIGNFTSIAEGCSVALANHRPELATTFPFCSLREYWPSAPLVNDHRSRGDVNIGNDVWIGAHVFIGSGVTIGDGAVIAAGSVVVKSVPDYAIVGGNPAQLIRFRFEREQIDALLRLRWWDWPDQKIDEFLPLIMSPDVESFVAAARHVTVQSAETADEARDYTPTDPAPLSHIGSIEATQLVSGAEQGGMITATRIAAASTTERRLPIYTNLDAVPEDLKPRVLTAFNQTLGSYPERHLLTLRDAIVVGQGSVVVSDGVRRKLLKDSAREFLAHERVPDGMDRDAEEVFAVNRSTDRHFEDDCLLLQRPWSDNYGHWLVDQAMTLSYLSHIGALSTEHIVVAKVFSPRLRQIMQETINAILPNAIVHEHPDSEVWQFRSLGYVMPLHVPPMTKLPAAMDFLRQDILAVPVPNARREKRIYVRRTGGGRTLVNESEIIALASQYGFECVSPESMSISEQAALFNGAEAILGVKGAAMTNVLFAGEGTSLLLMSSARFTDPFFYDIASVNRVAYSEVFGPALTQRPSANTDDFCIDPTAVEAMICAAL